MGNKDSKPKDLKELVKTTKFNEKEIKAWYKDFLKVSFLWIFRMLYVCSLNYLTVSHEILPCLGFYTLIYFITFSGVPKGWIIEGWVPESLHGAISSWWFQSGTGSLQLYSDWHDQTDRQTDRLTRARTLLLMHQWQIDLATVSVANEKFSSLVQKLAEGWKTKIFQAC